MPTSPRSPVPRTLLPFVCLLASASASSLAVTAACGDVPTAAGAAQTVDAGQPADAALDASEAIDAPQVDVAELAPSAPARAGAKRAREALPPLMVKRLEGVVNINDASPEELRLLAGIGPAKIHAILAYRRAHRFRTVDELARIKGIGRKMLRRLRLHLAVSGPTTAQQVIRPLIEPLDPAPAAPPPRPTAARPRTPPASVAPATHLPAKHGRPTLPHVIFPEAGANHCPRPR